MTATLAVVAGAAATDPGWTVTPLSSGLDSPRGLAVAANGTLYVAEGGHGGDVCGAPGHCIGTTARISRVDTDTGEHAPVATGLYSASSRPRAAAVRSSPTPARTPSTSSGRTAASRS